MGVFSEIKDMVEGIFEGDKAEAPVDAAAAVGDAAADAKDQGEGLAAKAKDVVADQAAHIDASVDAATGKVDDATGGKSAAATAKVDEAVNKATDTLA